ncbi:thioredoxin family protein [Paenimyroides aestuarii]|uniref:Thioredoxin family protein n=1 Tax=Paenimyroides aestuarii TaxID=2968490 RepID=A0ABY5NST5_9FLAO|nr:thioredoxin family protein [Paenimyroides aestuarii]UUV21588.1 thioredoxin family protein [Paenimyroides aestuarii]
MTFNLPAQTDCSKLLAQKIMLHDDFEKTQLELITNFSKLSACGLDDEDVNFLKQPPLTASIVIKLLNDDPDTVTYQKLMDEILKVRATPEYKESVKLYNDLLMLQSKHINLSDWDSDRKLLLKLFKDENLVHAIYQIIKENPNRYETYGHMMNDLNRIAEAVSKSEVLNEELPDFFKDSELINYKEMLQMAKKTGKPLLIYFSAYADVNSRRMEDAFLFDIDIQAFIVSNYHSITLFVDSKKNVPKESILYNQKNGKAMKTYGAFYIKLQKEVFNENRQPFFVIVDSEGKILKTQGFTTDKNEFQKFLN